jgi:RepB DNA-primase N-terminal domain
MSAQAQVDAATVRQFIEIICAHAAQVINGADRPGVLQLCRIHPLDDSDVVPSRFQIGDVEEMVKTAIGDAIAGHNVYIETRTVQPGLRGKQRGTTEETAWVFGLVVDSDADKGKGGNVTVRPSLAIETSPGNYHLWFLFTRAIPATQAKLIGEVIRANSGADQDTGVVTQCYRVAGTPNFPSTKKQARGRTATENTRIFEYTARLWDPDELVAAFSVPAASSQNASSPNATGSIEGDEATLPDDLLETIRNGCPPPDRSRLFHSVVGQLKRRNWAVEAIVTLFEKYPTGIAQKYNKRLRKEVERSYNKVPGGGAAAPVSSGSAGLAAAATAGPGPGPGPGTGASSTPQTPHVIPTIRIVDGQLPRTVEETEQALVAAGVPIFVRAGTLVEPVSESTMAANGRKTVSARLRPLCSDSLLEPVAGAAIFQRFHRKRNLWVDVDPPIQLVRMVLARERSWTIPRVSGIITTPTLRPDGSLLSAPGYDPRSELYLLPGLQLPPIPDRPTREQAEAALMLLIDLLSEFPFKDKLDRAVALSGFLTALMRGSLSTAPILLVRADTPGTGKSYLVDLFSMIATGRVCPVICASKSDEETQKVIGSILLSGTPIVSLDNCEHDLGGNILCQLNERPVMKIRVLGRSESPDCECRTAIFATGNHIVFKRDMSRRALTCNLEALVERPELRVFKRDALEHAAASRGAYVAAALTIVRAFYAAGRPEPKQPLPPLGSYAEWSRMVRAPLVWLGEPDPAASTDLSHEEDPEVSSIREFFELWLNYDLDLNAAYTTRRILDVACAPLTANNFNPPVFEQFLLRVAAGKDGKTVSTERLGHWLRRISGRVVGDYRLVLGRERNVASFKLQKIK